jgi:[acyl-carrier-protein] S-malonyltransferase
MPDLKTQGKAAFVFPGVGVTPSGHEGEFLERHRELMQPFLDEAAAYAGEALHATLAPAPGGVAAGRPTPRAEELFTFAFDCAVAAVYRQSGLEPSYVAGHSLGLYAALAVTGAVRFGDGLAMVERARAFVREACPPGQYGMAVVIGTSAAEIVGLLGDPVHAGVARANINNDTATVLSGRVPDLERFLDVARAEGAFKAALLDVDLPYHHPVYLAPATDRFRAFLGSLAWSAPCCPLVSPIDQALLEDPAELLECTACNISTPIRWQRVVERLAALGVAVAVECGPGISLTQHASFIPGAPKHVNTKTSAWKLRI